MYQSTLFIFFLISLVLLPPNADALTISDQNYQFEIGNIRLKPEILDPTPQPNIPQKSAEEELIDAIPNVAPQQPRSFTFSINNSLIDYGALSATNPVLRKSMLTISKESAIGYIITASADHPLESDAQITIPDTTCDNGTCSENTAASWTNLLTYGFGYRCDNVIGQDCMPDFTLLDYYKQFSDIEKGEKPTVIARGSDRQTQPQIQISYKVIIPGTQAKGAYNNTITVLAIPTF